MKDKEENQWVVNALHNLSHIDHLANEIDATECTFRIAYNIKEIKSTVEELYDELLKHKNRR